MTSKVYIDYVTPVDAASLNDINNHVYSSTPISPATTVHPASVIANTPAGTITEVTVQAALNGLDTRKAALAGSPTQTFAATAAVASTDVINKGQLASSSGASMVGNTPAGNIASTTVQAALNELDAEKALLAGSATQVFSVAPATAPAHAMSQTAADARYAALGALGGSSIGLYSARPAANSVTSGYIYYASDVQEAYRSNGTAWTVVLSGGNELGYAELTANFVTASTTLVAVSGLSFTAVVGERPIKFLFDGVLGGTASGSVINTSILLDGVEVVSVALFVPLVNFSLSNERSVILRGLTPGSTHTFSVKIQVFSGGGNASITGNSVQRSFIQAVTL